jgi:hypothetical protein
MAARPSWRPQPVDHIHRKSINRQTALAALTAAPTLLALALSVAVSMELATHAIAQQQSPPSVTKPAGAIESLEPPTQEQINSWIDELRDDKYSVRRNAAEQLLSAGSAARPPLVALVDSADPERRAAARRLVALIDQAEFDQRLAAFAADSDGREGLTLPGWEQFRMLVGGDTAARELFVDMQRSEASLLANVFDADRARETPPWEERLMRLVRRTGPPNRRSALPSLGTCATMIFLSSVAEAAVTDKTAYYLPTLMQRPPVQSALAKSRPRDPLRRLVAAWVVECPNHSATVIAKRLTVARNFKLSEAVPLAVAVATNDPEFLTVSPGNRAQALLLVAQLGKPSDADKLEPLLEDATVCQTFKQSGQPGQVIRQVQIRDLALVTMLLLTGQDPAEYGYVLARRQAQQVLNPGSLFAEDDAARAAAIARWRDWKAEQGGSLSAPTTN